MKKPFTLALVLLIGFVGGLVLTGRLSLTSPSLAAPEQTAPAVGSSRAAAAATGGLPDLTAIAEAALKASANISSSRLIRNRNPFPFFFDDQDQFERSTSLGSGVVVSADGYILTNNHVIGDAGADVRVTLGDGKEQPAKIIGVDDVTDLAVVKVDARGLQTLPWGDSSKLRLAEWVLAIGNPFQFTGTVTLGIVSNANRSGAQVGSAYGEFVQTDAAINPGNSGGALINARGELIGINTLIISESGGNQGIGLAISSNTARRIMDDLIKSGSIRWGALGSGVLWYELDRGTARQNGLGDIEGILVRQISGGSNLYAAGLRQYDVVVSLNGQRTTVYEELNRLVIPLQVGSRAKIEVVREGRRMTFDVPIVSRQTQAPRAPRRTL